MPVVIPYVVQTWTDGSSQATAARMGVMEQGITDAHNMPCARVYASAAQAIGSATASVILFNSERYDTDTIHDTVTNNSRLTCKHAGVYHISWTLFWTSSAAGTYRSSWLRINGTGSIASAAHVPSAIHAADVASGTDWKMAVNDYVELMVQQDSGGNLNATCELMMHRVATG